MKQPTSDWDATDGASERKSERVQQCAAYDVKQRRIVSQSCRRRLAMICNQPALDQRSATNSRPGDVAEYFCPAGWFSYVSVLDAGLCYRRFTAAEPVSWDAAVEECARHGSHLATAPTHGLRVALEQVYGHFNNESVVDSWIGLRQRDSKVGAFQWTNNTLAETTFSWQPFNEFGGGGYGVSTGISRMWWTWPRHVKLWGLVCQKSVNDWRDHLHLRLEEWGRHRYAVTFTYDPQPDRRDDARGDHQDPKHFWLAHFDVLCYLADYVIRFSMPTGYQRHYQTPLDVPPSMPAGQLTCEGWLNRPAFRFQSNTVVYRPPGSHSYVVHVAKQHLGADWNHPVWV